jgi:hypothetical protein
MNSPLGRTLWWFSVGLVALLFGLAIYASFYS